MIVFRNPIRLAAALLMLTACTPQPRDRVVAQARADVTERASAQVARTVTGSANAVSTTTFHFERVIVTPLGTGWYPQDVMVRDVTGDGLADVVLSLTYGGTDGSQGWVRVRIHASNLDGSLASPVELDVSNNVNAGHGLEVVDLDDDGRAEIIVGNRSGLTVFRWVDGAWARKEYALPGETRYMVSIDADADGHLDVFAQSWSSGADLFYGDGQGGFRSVAHVTSSAAGYNIVRAADFTADGRKDVVVTNGQGWPKFWVHPFDPVLGLRPQVEFDLRPAQPRPLSGIAVADVNRDGRPDLVTADEGSSIEFKGVRVFYRGAGDDFSRVLQLPTSVYYDYPGAVDVADIDGNGYPDIVVMLNSSDGMGYYLQNAEGFAPMVRVSVDDNPWSSGFYNNKAFEIVDLDRDGCKDVVLAESTTSLRVFYGRDCLVPRRIKSTPLPAQRAS